jgi:hypothetical protein
MATMVFLTVAGTALTAVAGETEPTPVPTATPSARDGKDLSSVAGEIKLNKDAAGSSGPIVINNENLPELAGKGQVTEVTKPDSQTGRRSLSSVQGGGGSVQSQGPDQVELAERKVYWQTAYKQQIDLITGFHAEIEVLDQQIPGLWRDFYSWDDPAYRDGVIKPKLDDALARRQELEANLQKGETRLEEIKQEARRDGAEPGWFRGLGSIPTPKPTAGILPS